ncbi:hypothetical protein PHMEG_00024421 [Phytophthora megakarya]|uniref:RxLR effector protein n=1 Tax=Phytophthora megakarya TaxID=4795 RepID=A0A225VH20_9STRA|nr:hypothetical protein PHMEG_00024421 [Phytophthora megakarya]
MRGYFALLATATTILFASSDFVASAGENNEAGFNEVYSVKTSETGNTDQRFVRRFESEDDEERRVVELQRLIKANRQSNAVKITSSNLKRIINTERLDETLDPKRAEKLLGEGKLLGGWLGKAELDTVLDGTFAQKKEVFSKWGADQRSAEQLTQLLKHTDPAIENKYRFVYVMYEQFLRTALKKVSAQ